MSNILLFSFFQTLRKKHVLAVVKRFQLQVQFKKIKDYRFLRIFFIFFSHLCAGFIYGTYFCN